MSAHLYVMRASDGRIKLGRSINPRKRRGQISNQINDDNLDLVYQTGPIEDVNETEHLAHCVLALSGEHIRDEWFKATPAQACDAIRIAMQQVAGAELRLGGRLSRVKDPKTKVVTVRINDACGETARQMAERDRRKLSSFLALIIEDAIATMQKAEGEKPGKERKS